MPEQPRKITINIDKIFEVAHKGVRRTYFFMGFGLNAAASPDLKEFHPRGGARIQFLPETLPDEVIETNKRHFADWIVQNGLRELIETFGVFMDQYYEICLIFDRDRKRGKKSPPQSKLTKFHRMGLEKKISTLKKETGIVLKLKDQLLSIQKARNCLTHNRGLVRRSDCQGDVLKVSWRAAEIFIKEPSGHEITFDHQTELPVHLPQGGDVCLRIVDRIKKFKVGTIVIFEGRELAEICWCVNNATELAKNPLLEFAKSKGVGIGSNALKNG